MPLPIAFSFKIITCVMNTRTKLKATFLLVVLNENVAFFIYKFNDKGLQ
mgnify:CR=1 FL=1